jgi:hypothetical protein
MLPGSPAAMVDTPSWILGCLADKTVHVSIGPVNVKHFSADAFLPDLLAEFKWELWKKRRLGLGVGTSFPAWSAI